MIAFLERERVAAEILATDLVVPLECESRGKVVWEPFDVRDGDACNEVFHRMRPTHVLHAAAVTLPDGTRENERLMVAVNLLGTCHVVAAARAVRSVARCILVSSSGVYGPGAAEEICDEAHALDLTGHYAWTKRQAELEMGLCAESGGMSSAVARVGPVYGPHEYSRSTRPQVSLVQQLADALCDGRVVRVAGTDFVRDWTHAADIAMALTGLLEAPELRERVYNVSSGVAIGAREVIALFAKSGLRVEWTEQTEGADVVLRPEQSRSPLQIECLRRDTGFEPQYELRSGVADVIARTRERLSCGLLKMNQGGRSQ